MTEQTEPEQQQAYVRFAAKTAPRSYESREASVSIPVPVNGDLPQAIQDAFELAKTNVFVELGIDYKLNQAGFVIEEAQQTPQAAAQQVAAAIPGTTTVDATVDLPNCRKCGKQVRRNSKKQPGSKQPDIKCTNKVGDEWCNGFNAYVNKDGSIKEWSSNYGYEEPY